MSAPQTRAPHLPLTQCTAFREMRLYRFWCMEFFYPNLQNDMWRIIGQVFFGDKLHFCTPDKRFKYEEIVGNASDEHLEIVEQTDIAALLQHLPQCHDICCTGGKAAETLAEILHTTTPKVGESLDKKAAAYQNMFAEIGIVES